MLFFLVDPLSLTELREKGRVFGRGCGRACARRSDSGFDPLSFLPRAFRAGFRNDPPEGVNASPRSDNIMLWRAVILGPQGTIWDGGIFLLSLEFSEEYPNRAPVVRFKTPMFHPNVYNHGGICLDILQNQWSPIYDVSAVLTSIQSLLSDPNPASPANSQAARLYVEDREAYNAAVRKVVEDTWEAERKLEDGDSDAEDDRGA